MFCCFSSRFKDPTVDKGLNKFELKVGCCVISQVREARTGTRQSEQVDAAFVARGSCPPGSHKGKITLYIKECLEIYGLNEVVIDDIT